MKKYSWTNLSLFLILCGASISSATCSNLIVPNVQGFPTTATVKEIILKDGPAGGAFFNIKEWPGQGWGFDPTTPMGKNFLALLMTAKSTANAIQFIEVPSQFNGTSYCNVNNIQMN